MGLQYEHGNHNGFGDRRSVRAHFGGIGATMFTDTGLDISRCVVEDLENSKGTDGEADNKVDKEHSEVEFDEPQLPCQRPHQTTDDKKLLWRLIFSHATHLPQQRHEGQNTENDNLDDQRNFTSIYLGI